MSGEPESLAPEEKSPEGATVTPDPTDGVEARPGNETSDSSPPEETGEATADEASHADSGAVPSEAESPRQAPSPNGKKGKGKKTAVLLDDDDEDLPVKGAYHVELPAFEGPLDLLLHLIQQHELDIKDIPIAFVSEKYLEYIVLMQDLNIDLASEYLVMAATLAHIKSKMLLPKPPADQDDESAEDLDPRGELVRRLLEYQKYKHAAEHLGKSPVLGRDVFVRGAPAPSIDGPAPLAQVSVFKLFDAFQRLLSKAKQTQEHLIDVDKISISERIIQLTDILRGRGRVPFVELFNETTTRPDLIVSFLAVLEMTRLRMMIVIQEGSLAPIEIELTLADEHDEILKQDLSDVDPLTALARGDVAHTAAAGGGGAIDDQISPLGVPPNDSKQTTASDSESSSAEPNEVTEEASLSGTEAAADESMTGEETTGEETTGEETTGEETTGEETTDVDEHDSAEDVGLPVPPVSLEDVEDAESSEDATTEPHPDDPDVQQD